MSNTHVGRRQLVTDDEAVTTPKQHQQPCGDCPWARTALRGWLGNTTASQWLQDAHGEARIDCHTLRPHQCVGAAIYRANVCKAPRDPEALRMPVDRATVFATPGEFLAHHDEARKRMVFVKFGSHRHRHDALNALVRKPQAYWSMKRRATGGYYLLSEMEIARVERVTRRKLTRLRGPFTDLMECWS